MGKLKKFIPFIKNKKTISTNWIDKIKRKNNFSFFQLDEIVILFTGINVFYWLHEFLFIFAILVLIWYWFKIRYYERLIIRKKRDIYNIQYDNAEGVTQTFAEGKTEEDRKPMYYDLGQFEERRKFLVEIFIVINLILLILLKL